MPGTLTFDRAPTTRPTPEQRPYQPRGAARELMRCRAREVLLAGPAGTGKSRACLEKLHLAATLVPRFRGALVRKTRTSLTQSAMVTLAQRVQPEPSGVWFHHADQEYRYPNGARVIVAGLDDPEKIKSTEFDLIYVQEATELEEIDWGMLLSRLRNGALSYQQLLADCNPSHPHHWLKLRCDRGDCLLFESHHEDNPTLTPAYIATLDALTGYLYQRLRLGLWVAAEGQFFPEFNPERHTVPAFPIPPHWPRWTATDYGYAAPFCHLALARDPATRRVYVHRELYAAGLRDAQQADLITARVRREREELGLDAGARLYSLHVGDPSMFAQRSEQDKPSIASVYRARGVLLERGLNNRRHGWQVVRDALADQADGKPRLQILRGRCPNLERTLPAMVHDPLDPEDLADAIGHVKTDDHAADCLRYALVAEAGAPRRDPVPVVFGDP